MALQLRSLLATSCVHSSLSGSVRIPSTMLQYRVLQNFPCPHFVTGAKAKYGKPPGGLCLQLRSRDLCSSGYRIYPVFRISGDGDSFGSLSHRLVGRRLFSSNTKKQFFFRAKSKVGDNVALGDKKSGLRGSTKHEEKAPAACDIVNGHANVAVTKPPRKTAVKKNKPAATAVDAAESKDQIQVGDKKKAASNSSVKTQAAKDLSKKVKKPATKKKVIETSGRSIAAAAEPDNQEKTLKKNISLEALHVTKTVDQSQCSTVEVTKNGSQQFMPLYPPSGKSVMVVESATKAKVIQNYLGDMFEVIPSYGHVRDLAAKSRSVRPDEDFSMVWEVPASAWTHLKSIKVALSGADNLILASDPDREGEAIAWHIIEMLRQQDALSENITVARVVFHEITLSSIKSALQAPREIDSHLVNAYLARRALDYLIGFNISPLLWRKLPRCPSAGRVQSAALALICDREMEIEKFNQQEYWTVGVSFDGTCSSSPEKRTCISSQLTHFKSRKLDQLSICSDVEAKAIEEQVHSSKFVVVGIKTSKVHKTPPMPYITSTLQQDSANKLHFTASYTMKLAQKLYEGVKLSDKEATGLITYMRTDGLHVSNDAVEDVRSLIRERYGEQFMPKTARKYFRKVKNAQEAHEAIRPTNIRRLPSSLVGVLEDDSLKLYTLIWTRTMACQMECAITDMIQVGIENMEQDMILRSVGSRVAFQGYEAVYQDIKGEISDNDDNEGNARAAAYEVLHKLKVNDTLSLGKVELKQHYTKPPARYSEGALVRKLEELGIGRPSTYASIMKVLQDRSYVTMKSRVLHPEFRGRMVSAFLSNYFSEVSDYSFTADMENELDNVSAGATEWKGLLHDYWSRFNKYCDLASQVEVRQIEKILEKKFHHMLFDPLLSNSRVCPSCSQGTLRFKISKFGAGYFIGCDQHPSCKYIEGRMLGDDDGDDAPSEKVDKSFPPKLLGHIASSNEKVFLKNGPYGYYVQLGDDRKGYSPKRASVSEVKDIDSITLEDAVELLRYPVTLGKHPDDKYPVVLAHSKFGYSIKHRRTIAPVSKNTDPKKITLETALKLLKGKNIKQSGRPKRKPKSEEEAFLE